MVGQGGATLASPRLTTGAPRHSKCKAQCAWVSRPGDAAEVPRDQIQVDEVEGLDVDSDSSFDKYTIRNEPVATVYPIW